MLLALAAFGGIGYASSTARHAIDAPVNVVRHAVHHSTASKTSAASANVMRNLTSASDQYKPGCGFGDKNHIHTGPPGNHNGFPGICPPSAGGGNGGAKCNSGRGNGSETPSSGTNVNGLPNDCDPGNSGPVNHGGD
jgi:hypothetical protein